MNTDNLNSMPLILANCCKFSDYHKKHLEKTSLMPGHFSYHFENFWVKARNKNDK